MIDIIPVEKNKEYEIEIESVTSEGMGVGHIDGFCVFVSATSFFVSLPIQDMPCPSPLYNTCHVIYFTII